MRTEAVQRVHTLTARTYRMDEQCAGEDWIAARERRTNEVDKPAERGQRDVF